MNYKIVISEGCTAFYTEINGKMWSTEYEPAQMSLDEKNQFIDYLLSKLKEGVMEGCIDVDTLIKHLVEDETWYLYRPMREQETPEVYSFQEKSSMGIMEGKVIFTESK